MTANDFRRLALALPETAEKAHMDHPDFRVCGKIFATLGLSRQRLGNGQAHTGAAALLLEGLSRCVCSGDGRLGSPRGNQRAPQSSQQRNATQGNRRGLAQHRSEAALEDKKRCAGMRAFCAASSRPSRFAEDGSPLNMFKEIPPEKEGQLKLLYTREPELTPSNPRP